MRLIGWRERQRQIQAALDIAWETAGHVPEDPGLRERYASLPRAPIRLISCPLTKNVNQGGLLRLADAFRLELVDLAPVDEVDFSAHRGTREYQPFRWIEVEDSIEEARGLGYRVLALTMNPRSIALERLEWQFPTAIVLGSENEGVPPEIESMCDLSVAIPLYGMVTSLNVVSAAAIVVHDAIRAYSSTHDFQPARAASAKLTGS